MTESKTRPIYSRFLPFDVAGASAKPLGPLAAFFDVDLKNRDKLTKMFTSNELKRVLVYLSMHVKDKQQGVWKLDATETQLEGPLPERFPEDVQKAIVKPDPSRKGVWIIQNPARIRYAFNLSMQPFSIFKVWAPICVTDSFPSIDETNDVRSCTTERGWMAKKEPGTQTDRQKKLSHSWKHCEKT